jgi:sugar lactone lactonase YvrE
MTERTTTVVLEGRGFLEAPHWHGDEVWTSDLHRQEVIAVSVSVDAATRVVATLDDQPSGLGFLPDGSAIVVSLLRRAVLRVSDLSLYADLADLTVGGSNDMIVVGGRAYVGSFGYDVFGRAPRAPGNIVVVDADGSARVAADGLAFPNGMAVTDSGTLLVAETQASRIVEFDIGDDGSLHDRRVWAELPGRPDGMTFDAEGAAWVALSRDGRFVRVLRGGRCVDSVVTRPGWRAISCCLGGDDLRSLYGTTALVNEPHATAALEVARVDVPGRSMLGRVAG